MQITLKMNNIYWELLLMICVLSMSIAAISCMDYGVFYKLSWVIIDIRDLKMFFEARKMGFMFYFIIMIFEMIILLLANYFTFIL